MKRKLLETTQIKINFKTQEESWRALRTIMYLKEMDILSKDIGFTGGPKSLTLEGPKA